LRSVGSQFSLWSRSSPNFDSRWRAKVPLSLHFSIFYKSFFTSSSINASIGAKRLQLLLGMLIEIHK
jgi:hypothetical protein